jgi:hypothetical protein
MSDEVWFHVSGNVNAQNSRIWNTENPHVLIFFEDRVNSDRYVSDTLEPFFKELTEEETRYGYFQQDSATAKTACNSMQRLRDVFDDEQIISQGL